MPELRINPDKVCELIEMAREVVRLEPFTADEARIDAGDDSPPQDMVEPPGGMDPRRVGMVEYVGSLNVAEQTDLLALIALGRGDYGIEEWHDALIAARDAIDDRSADFMIGDPALPAHLREALDAFDRSYD